jgi:hypothetical protein
MKKQYSRKATKPTSKAKTKGIKGWFSSGNLSQGTFVLPSDSYVENTPNELQYSAEDYIPFLDAENGLLRQLFTIVNTSPTNRAIVLQKVSFAMGDGLNIFPKSNIFKHTEGELTDEQKEKVSDYLENVNIADNEDFETLRNKVTRDFVQYGNAFLELTKASNGMIYQRHLPVSWCRPKKMDINDTCVSGYGLSKKWLEYNINPSDLIKYNAFPNFAKVEGLKGERCILQIKAYSPEYLYWGMPDWLAAVYYGEVEYRVAKYNNSRFDNGFAPSAIVQMFDTSMTDDEASEFAKQVSKTFTGTGNNSKIFTVVTEAGTEALKVNLLDDKSEGTFLELSKIARENIVTGHRWTQSLAGIGVAGSLGSNQQIRAEYEILKQTVIEPMNDIIFGQWVNKVLKYMAVTTKDNDYLVRLDASLSAPVSLANEIDYDLVLSTDELREAAGYERLEDVVDINEQKDI